MMIMWLTRVAKSVCSSNRKYWPQQRDFQTSDKTQALSRSWTTKPKMKEGPRHDRPGAESTTLKWC